MNDNLVPEPRNTVFDSVQKALGDEQAARRVMANPALAKGFPNGRPQQDADAAPAPRPTCARRCTRSSTPNSAST